MTFYGIERISGSAIVLRWQSSMAKPPRGAMDWAYFSESIKKPGRELYMTPKGWRRNASHGASELARAIEKACQVA